MQKHFGDGLEISWRYGEMEESRIDGRFLDLENQLDRGVIHQGDELCSTHLKLRVSEHWSCPRGNWVWEENCFGETE